MTTEIESEVEEKFAAPEFRQYQKKAIVNAVKALESGKKAVLIDAPTGFGKSLVLHCIALYGERNSFYTTPLKSLQDQIMDDDFFGAEIVDIKGRSNYFCHHPDEDNGVTVDKALCQRKDGFECDMKDSCSYYSQKGAAIDAPIALMNTSYMMAEGKVPPEADYSFDDRHKLVIDECQSLEDWALSYVTVNFGPYSVPKEVWDAVDVQDIKGGDIKEVREWLEDEVRPIVVSQLEKISQITNLDGIELDREEMLNDFKDKVDRFIEDSKENEWVVTFVDKIRKNRPNYTKIECKPIYVDRFMEGLVWSRANKYVLASATLPPDAWLDEIGLSRGDCARIKVPHTFPVENRPVITNHAVGKMTQDEREKNMPAAVKKVYAMSSHHEGEKGIIHARGYNYINMFERTAKNLGYRDWFNSNVHVQDRSAREESLEKWIKNDKQIFLSVNMSEGIDLKGDVCRWQVLLKTLYPHMGDERVKKRVLDMGDWDWYNRHAVTQIEQAYGRAVRSMDDEAVFYILDKSAIDLIKMNAENFHTWFLEAIQDMKIDPSRGI